jgi:hypothetical protein
MTNNEENAYLRGGRAAWVRLLGIAIKELGYKDGTEVAKLISERESAIASLRDLCAAHGDNDWNEELHLSDIIDKHLGRHLS